MCYIVVSLYHTSLCEVYETSQCVTVSLYHTSLCEVYETSQCVTS